MNTVETFWHNITLGEQRVLLWLRGAVSGITAALAQWLYTVPQDLQRAWSAKEWAVRASLVALPTIVGLIGHGDKNPPAKP